MTADAVVVSARADSIDLEFAPKRDCGACAGTCLWKRLKAARLDHLPVAEPFEAGAMVSVALSGRRVLLASLLVYGAPLLAILLGAAAGSVMTGSDLGTFVGAILALALVFSSFGLLRRRLERATLSGLTITARP